LNATNELHQPRLRALTDEPKSVRVEDVSNETKSTVDEDSKSVDDACEPLVAQLDLTKGEYKRFVVDSCAGLLGSDTLRQYPCLMDYASSKFYVWLSDTDFALFTKSTFMNLCNFAENHGATKVLLLLDTQHAQKK